MILIVNMIKTIQVLDAAISSNYEGKSTTNNVRVVACFFVFLTTKKFGLAQHLRQPRAASPQTRSGEKGSPTSIPVTPVSSYSIRHTKSGQYASVLVCRQRHTSSRSIFSSQCSCYVHSGKEIFFRSISARLRRRRCPHFA